VIPCLRREVDEIRALLGFYAASSGNSIAIFGSRHLEDEAEKLSRDVGKELPLLAAQYSQPRSKQQNNISQKSADLRIISLPLPGIDPCTSVV